MKQKLKSILAAALCAVWFTGVAAPDAVQHWDVGEGVTAYTNGVGELVVEGAGDMKDFASAGAAPWGKAIASATIGEDVTGIGTNAFKDCASLTSVTVLATVPPTLEKGAFSGCSVKTILVPKGTGAAYKSAPGWRDYARIISEKHDLVVLNADGSRATGGYYWSEKAAINALVVTNDGLTVTGTTTTERVELQSAQKLTLRDLYIDLAANTNSGKTCLAPYNAGPVTVNVEGKVVMHTTSNAIYMHDGGTLTIGGSGEIEMTVEKQYAAVYVGKGGGLVIADSVNLMARCTIARAFATDQDKGGAITISSSGRIDLRSESKAGIFAETATGKLAIEQTATNVVVRGFTPGEGGYLPGETGALEFHVDDAVSLPAGWAIFGSPDIDAADMPVAAEMWQVPGTNTYTCYIGEDFARAVTFGPVESLTIPSVENAFASVGGVSVPAGTVGVPAGRTSVVTWEPRVGYKITSGETEALVMDGPKTAKAPTVETYGFLLYPAGDGAFRPATKSTTYYGALIGTNGIEGTITVKMTKPNKKGQFNLAATVKTFVGKQSYSFKAKKVTVADGVAAEDGALAFTLVGLTKKAKAHTLAVTLGGDSLTGAFDGCQIDGARHVFSTSRDPKREAVTPFVGTWTGVFAEAGDANGVSVTAFSTRILKSGSAWVKVYFADGKTASCTAKAEVGAEGVVAFPVTAWRSVKGGKRSFGFRLVFGKDADGNAACEATDVTPVRDRDSKTGEVSVAGVLEFLAASKQTVKAKDFKSYAVAVDPALTESLGPVAKSSLRLSASTGRITGTLKWKVASVDARGGEKTKTVTGKATGIMLKGVGIGTVTIKQGKETETFAFAASRKSE